MHVKGLTTVVMILSIVFCHSGWAAKKSRRFPLGCRDVGYEFHGENLVLIPIKSTKNDSFLPEGHSVQTLYLIHNQSHYRIQIMVPQEQQRKYQPRYENIIRGSHWASFAMDRSKIDFSCHEIMGGQVGPRVNCQSILELCQYNNAKFASHNGGSYWVIQSGTRYQAKWGSIKAGILLRS